MATTLVLYGNRLSGLWQKHGWSMMTAGMLCDDSVSTLWWHSKYTVVTEYLWQSQSECSVITVWVPSDYNSEHSVVTSWVLCFDRMSAPCWQKECSVMITQWVLCDDGVLCDNDVVPMWWWHCECSVTKVLCDDNSISDVWWWESRCCLIWWQQNECCVMT